MEGALARFFCLFGAPCPAGVIKDEADFSAQEASPPPATRLPGAHGYQGREANSKASPVKGAQARLSLMTVQGTGASPARSLRNRREFDQVFQDGRSRGDRLFAVYVRDSEETDLRLGMVVSRRVGNAVARNRIRRVVREVLRQNREHIRNGVDVIVIARRGSRTLASPGRGLREAEDSLLRLFEQVGIMTGGGKR